MILNRSDGVSSVGRKAALNGYTAENTLVLGKRHHNIKRTYLLINPLQAKHLPVSPGKSLKMMTCLGMQIARKYPEAKLVIGFAETATAVAAAVAGCLGDDCRYIHTTRETCGDLSDWIYFQEEHSHAVEQKLYCGELATWTSGTSQIIFVDDEISTGKTLLNVIGQLRKEFPEIRNKKIVAASIINRLSREDEKRFSDAGIESVFLVKMGGEDLTEAVAHFEIAPAGSVNVEKNLADYEVIQTDVSYMNARLGVTISKYKAQCQAEAAKLAGYFAQSFGNNRNVLVLGTEECMYPSLILGQELERSGIAASVKCHATTRSPIGICQDEDYPIHSGFKLHSLYDNRRETYIYNLTAYDVAVVVTDTTEKDPWARSELSEALRRNGCPRVIFVEGGCHV